MPLEPISFKCSACTKTSAGEMFFVYKTEIRRRGVWRIHVEHEYTDEDARCEHCGAINQVWPEHSVDLKWEKIA
jgi:DNA-directed RNA polymerase subunit RPC12/RpoP